MSLLKYHLATPFAVGYSVLLVVNDILSLTTTDTAIQGLLATLGYSVTTIEDSTVTSGSSAGYDAVVVSYGSAGSVGNTLQNITEPLVSCYTPVSNNSEISDTASNGFSETAINIVDNTHPITTGLSTGDLTVTSTNQMIAYTPDAGVGSGATILGERSGDATNNLLFIYDAGDTLSDLSVAAGKRVFTWVSSATLPNHTTAGNDLLKKVFQWAVGEI